MKEDMAKRELDNSPEAKSKRVRTSRRSKWKGNVFELLCAHKIADAAGAPFRIEQMFDPTQEIGEYHNQVLAALERAPRPNIHPLLVVRGNGGLIYCASYRDALN